MKAVVMKQPGGPEVLEVQELAVPTPSAAREIRVRLKAAGVNPVDAKLRGNGTYFPERSPAVLGCDGAGIVEDVGSGVTRFRPGDEVYFCYGGIGGPQGNYAEQAVIDERWAAPKPAALDFVHAAAAPLVLITAWESLHDRGRLAAGQTVLVHAGAGGVGHVAIQLARAAGARVCTTVGSAAKADLVRELGAEAVIRYKDTDFVQAALDWTGGQGVDVALDTVGGKTFEDTASAVRVYGDLVTLLQPAPDTDWKAARLRNLRISLELMLSPMYYGIDAALEHQAWILGQCAQLIDSGRLRIDVQQTFPLEQAAAAHALLEQGSLTGKLVLVP
ncbi:MAG: zinc-dependent alcohol dehydrogenase family protein [Gammaproteobacteria bacterium]